MSMTLWILLFVIVDAIVLTFVLRHALRKRGGLSLAGLDFKRLARFSKLIHEETGRYLQANYSGDPRHLPQAVQGLMSMAQARAEQEGLALDADVLKKLIETSAIKHRVAKAGEVRAALERAA